jgi:membrane-bound serine protease (ClpP class)
MKKLFIILIAILLSANAYSQSKVMVMEIKDVIDTRTTRYVKLSLEHALKTNADVVIIDMDTYGGTLTDAKDIAKLILDFEKPIWVYIHSNAISAGALISIACDSIYMSSGASIGAATVVTGDGVKAIDKYQSGMRSFMRATAEENGRDPLIAEGMVDEALEIEGVKKEGQIITFSTAEAIQNGYCEGKFERLQHLLDSRLPNATVEQFELTASEKIIAFFLNPFISGLLILLIIGGIYFELQTPGFGFAGIAAAVALVLYLVPYYLNGLAAHWEIIAFFIGILLIAAEIFVIPGFGIAGISGMILTFGSLVLIMLNNDFFDFEFVAKGDLITALAVSSLGIMGGVALLFIAGPRILRSKQFQKIALTDTHDSREGYSVKIQDGNLVGKSAIAQTVLRPGGKILLDGKIYDAVSRGEYIEQGSVVEIIDDETSTFKVRSKNA